MKSLYRKEKFFSRMGLIPGRVPEETPIYEQNFSVISYCEQTEHE